MPRPRLLRALALGTSLLSTATVLGATLAPPASAESIPVSQARGYFLAGTAGGTDIVPDPLAGARAVNETGGPAVTQSNQQSLGDLSSFQVPLPGGGSVPVGKGLQFGVLNQYATANPDGSAAGSSGAIADNGTIQAGDAAGGPAGDATLDLGALGSALTDALPEPLQGLGEVTLTAGALAAHAQQDAFDPAGTAGAQSGSYRIGSLDLTLRSAALTALVGGVRDAYAAAEGDLVDALDTALTALAPAGGVVDVEISALPDPLAVFGDPLAVAADGVTVDLGTGRISVDLVALVKAVTGKDVNALPPNTDLMALLQQALASTDLVDLVAGQVQNVVDGGRDALLDALGTATATVTVAGVPLPVSGGTLLELLGVDAATALPGVDALTTALGTLTDGLPSGAGTLLGALGSALAQLLGVTVNRQVVDGSFTETALALSLLPGGIPGSSVTAALLDVGLANASVGPGARPAVVTPPTTAAPTPVSEVPTLANTGPFETLGGLAVGTWAVVAGVALLLAAGAVRRSRRPHVGTHRT